MSQATIRSNSGNSEFTLELDEPSEYACEPGFQASLHLRGEHWDGDHTFPISTSVQGLWLRAADITALCDHLTRWTSLPLESLLAAGLAGEFELARLPEQSLRIRFEANPETHRHANPEVHFSFAAGTLSGHYSFVTDQSCLASFVSELRISAVIPFGRKA